MRAAWIASLAATALLAVGAHAQTRDVPAGTGLMLVTPTEPVGRKSERGVVISSAPDGFEIELAGEQLQPLASDQLLWDVDGLRIELLLLRRTPDPGWSAADAIREIAAATGAKDIEVVSLPAGTAPRQLWATVGETVAAAAIAKGVLVLKLSGPEPPGAANQRDYLKRVLMTVRETVPAPRLESASAIKTTGATLQQQLGLNSALTGESHIALLNGTLATATDRTVSGTQSMDPASLTEFARWLLGLGETQITVSVFDGRVAHAINLIGYDFTSESFIYRDPWGQGSFLQKANNAAGIDAKPYPIQSRLWWMSFAELESVLYSVIGRERVLREAFRLCALAGASPQLVFRHYAELVREDDPQHKLVTPSRLEGTARYLYRVERPQVAAALLALRSTLSGEPPAGDLVALARSHGVADLAAYARTLERAAAAPPERVAAQPMSRDKALASDFFGYFGLQQVQATADSASYRPRSPKFAQLVELTLHFDESGWVTVRELAIRHDFITDPAAGVFAADLMKSFLLFAAGDADRTAVQPLASEIFGSRARRITIPGAYRTEAWVPAMPSAGVEAFRGMRGDFAMVLPATTLAMHHSGEGDKVDLRVTVTPR